MKKKYFSPEYEFIMFSEADVLTKSVFCSTPDTSYYEGVGTYADAACFQGETFDGELCG